MQDTQFEQQVLAQITPFAGQAAWFSHTLFVKCDEDTARSIFHKLTETHGLGHVLVSKAGSEYAFDFI